MPMQILPQSIAKTLPALYATEHDGDATVRVKFFNPCGSGTWYATEANAILTDGSEVALSTLDVAIDGKWRLIGADAARVEDIRFFGLADLGYPELGYFVYSEMSSVRLPFGLMIERDMYFSPAPLSTLKP